MIFVEVGLGIAALIVAGVMLQRVGDLDVRLRQFQRNPARRPSLARWPSEPTEDYHIGGWPLLSQRSRAQWQFYIFGCGGVALLSYAVPKLIH